MINVATDTLLLSNKKLLRVTKTRKKTLNKHKSLRNYLIENAPELIKYWDKSNQDKIFEISPYVDRKYIWKCQTCDDGTFQARPKDVFRKEKIKRQKHCKQCSIKERSKKYLKSVIKRDGSLLDHMPTIADEWDYDLNKKNPEEYSRSSHDQVYFKCLFGHESYPATIYNKFYSQTKCPKCRIQTSEAEVRIYCELKSLFKKTKWQKKVRNKEVDVLVPELNLAIEVDGYPWHLDKTIQDNNKTKILLAENLIVVRIRDKQLPNIGGNIVKCDLVNFQHKEFLKFINLLKKIFKSKIPKKLSNSKEFLAEKEFREIYSKLPKPPYEESLEHMHPKAKEIWDYEMNYPLTPDMFKQGSSKSVWWKCKKNHSWKNQINRVFRKDEYKKDGTIRKAAIQRCPKCPKKIYYPEGQNFEFRGEKFISFADACRKFGVTRTYVYQVAIKKNISPKEALIQQIQIKKGELKPIRKGTKFNYKNKSFNSLAEACRHFNISRTNIYRVAKSKSITKEKALLALIER